MDSGTNGTAPASGGGSRGAAIIEITDLRKAYGATVAVDGISLRVDRGEVFGVLGPNGAGKTTTVECAVGLRRPDGGTVRVLGMDPAADPERVRRRVGIQLQQAVLPQRMTVREAMAVFASAYRGVVDPAALLDEWGLREHRRTAFGKLSGGQRQRLFIALALLGDPEVVVLDELTTGLDPAARRDTWSLVRGLRTRGVTVVLVTHAMDEAEMLCDRLVVIDRGRIVAEGAPDAVRGEHRSLETAYLALTGTEVA
ncbi:ABC transporter ATP-binding protein [Pseudonocardia humida]|uniref:ABC transporter ATP-binding protein n=1 Tax=Pseudonocardia humida TaxID=2800819 RepID=A0ABT1A3E0_9PSEU|nr:ABC transporter ATP-binding protein [Pseudonocardia humida]MCO1657319.1 ABC transporter ATP-binding protein [Pseudonocardia humida]